MTITQEPTYQNIAYGAHERQVLDLWVADTREPSPFYVFFHGGGFCSGDKNLLPPIIRDELLAAGVSVAAANYRYTDDPELFAPLLDGKYAVQYLRAHAKELHLNPARVAAGGGSAGSVNAFWLGFRPDMADPTSDDLPARQSTRLTCIAAWEPQTTLDPLFIREIIAGPTWEIGSIAALCQLTLDQYDTPPAKELFRDLAFTEMIAADTPPVFLYNLTPNLPNTPDLPVGPGIHHPIFGKVLKEQMDPAGIECITRTVEDVPDVPTEEIMPLFQRELAAFVARQLYK
ncbi:MAG: alpha/beta hydrolase [Armatimonadota bacterium]